MFNRQNRREFLKTSFIVASSLVLPKSLLATESGKFFFIQTDPSGNHWPASDPVQWSLDNVHNPILERARDGLLRFNSGDSDRIIRLVVRRCGLNLIELHPNQVVIHYWGPHRADVRSFFKSHGLARQDIKVVLRNRKNESIDSMNGDEFLFGELVRDFPLELFQTKWIRRFVSESDDWAAVPRSMSGYAWENLENNRIPWSSMKSAWRKSAPMICLNCDSPMLLTNFGNPWTSMFNRTPRFIHICGKCQRSFRDYSVKDARDWMAMNLDEEVLPNYDMVWDRRVTFQKNG